jgi:chorismate mutase
MAVRGLRGATTIEVDTESAILERTEELLSTIFERNALHKDQLISILFTATPDIHGSFPAAAARAYGLGDVPLMCAQEIDVTGATPRCIRVLMHLETDRSRSELHHIYLHEARSLRDDLPQ